MKNPFGRLITAMVTPFHADKTVNYDEAVRLAHFLVETGSDTVLLAGTTGESPTLTAEEELELFRVVVHALKGKAKVMAGTGSNCTATAVEATQNAEKMGVDGVLQVVPYYNKPSQEGIYQHFKAVSEATRLPIVLYNIPGRTSRNMEPETMGRLAKMETIIGVKESAGSVIQVEEIRKVVPKNFVIYSGDDGLTLPFMEHGAYGVISVASHCAGTQIKEMVDAFAKGDKKEAYALEKKLEALFEVLFITSNPTPVKAALAMMGFKVGGLRLPLIEATPEEKAKIRAVLAPLVVLKA